MPPEELDDDVGADDEGLGIRREELSRKVGVARRVDVAHGDADELERRAGTIGELRAVAQEQRRDLRADGAGSEQRDAQAAVVGHVDSLRSLSTGMLSLRW